MADPRKVLTRKPQADSVSPYERVGEEFDTTTGRASWTSRLPGFPSGISKG